MTPRPSEPLLQFLRNAVRQKGYTTAELSRRTGIDRTELKRRLAGVEPMTVDDFVQLSQALDLSAADLGISQVPTVVEDATPESPGTASPDPLGNLPAQILRLGFTLGVDLFLQLDSTQLAGSGVPRPVLARFPEILPLRLEARYHRHNRPRFEADHFECVLSFDALYTCTFPWSSFRAIRFDLPEAEAVEPEPPPPPARPTLRVIK